MVGGSGGSGKDNEFRVIVGHLGIDIHSSRSCGRGTQKHDMSWRSRLGIIGIYIRMKGKGQCVNRKGVQGGGLEKVDIYRMEEEMEIRFTRSSKRVRRQNKRLCCYGR